MSSREDCHPKTQPVRLSFVSIILGAALGILAPSADAAQTSLVLHSDAGDYIGAGNDYTYSTANGSFSVQRNSAGGVSATFTTTFGGVWSFDFAAPGGAPLAPGLYFEPTTYPTLDPARPALRASAFGRSASNVTGFFQVKQVTYNLGGGVTSLWVTFAQHCEGGRPVLTGDLRWFASGIVALSAPPALSVVRGQELYFDITATATQGNPVILTADGLPAGATCDDWGNNTASFYWLPGPDDIGEYHVMFRGRNQLGAQDSTLMVLNVAGLTSLRVASDPGDPVGMGVDHSYSDLDGAFRAASDGVTVTVDFVIPGAPTHWTLQFAAPAAQPMAPGIYGNAGPDLAASAQAGMRIIGDGRECAASIGGFEIRQLSFDAFQHVRTFWATFEQHCDGAPDALRGEIRYNADVRLDISAPLCLNARRGDTISFFVIASDMNFSPLALTAEGLPAGATFHDYGDNSGVFSWPTGMEQAGEFRVRFIADDGAGGTGSATTVIRLPGEDALILTSDPGDPVGGGQSREFHDADGRFSLARLAGTGNGVEARFAGNSGETWTVRLDAAADAPLGVGPWFNALLFPSPRPDRAGLAVLNNGSACDSIAGYFEVLEIHRDPFGILTGLRARFRQQCNAQPAALRGEIQYNVMARVFADAPLLTITQAGAPLSVAMTSRSLLAGPLQLAVSNAPAGALFSDHGDGTGLLTWTPGYDQVGEHVVTFHARDAGGAEGAASAVLRVTGVNSLSLESDPGDPVGGGRFYFTNGSRSIFDSAKRSDNSVRISVRDSSGATWSVDLAGPDGAPLSTGVYDMADAYPTASPGRPGIRIAGPGSSCAAPVGRFEVLQIASDVNGGLFALRATFDQQCDGLTAGLHGEIRLNAGLPVTLDLPVMHQAVEEDSVGFDVTAHGDGPVALSAEPLPAGAAFHDRGDGTGHFGWRPGLTQAGTYDVVFHATDLAGRTDQLKARIVITNRPQPPTAHAAGPYAGMSGQPVTFDGSRSADPDGGLLDFSWRFGDGERSGEMSPTHTYAAAGRFTVALIVCNAAGCDSDTTVAMIEASLPPVRARAWTSQANNPIRLDAHRPYNYVNIEPAPGSFLLSDVVLSSIALVSNGTGSVSSIPVVVSQTDEGADRDKNGVPEIQAAFSRGDLRLLFSQLTQRTRVGAGIVFRLADGRSGSAPVDLEVIPGGRGVVDASVLSESRGPVLWFVTASDGPIEARLFDLSGRLVRTLVDNPAAPAGEYNIPLDRGASGGIRLAPGIYFYRVETDEGVVGGKVLIAR